MYPVLLVLNASVLTELHLYVLLHLSMIIIIHNNIIHQTYVVPFKELKDALHT